MNPGSSIPVLGGTGYLGSRVGSRVLRLWRARHPTKLDYGPLCFWVVGWYIFVSVVCGGLFLVFLGGGLRGGCDFSGGGAGILICGLGVCIVGVWCAAEGEEA